MIESLHIQNFRCFADLVISPLGRVNLIAGKNNTGKTALLEALFLYSGKAAQPGRWLDLVVTGPRARSSEGVGIGLLTDDLQWLFYGYGQTANQEIALCATSKGAESRLTAHLSAVREFPLASKVREQGRFGLQGNQGSQLLGEDSRQQDLFIEVREKGASFSAFIHLAGAGRGTIPEPIGQGEAIPCRFLPPTSKLNASDLNQFSKLKGEKRERAIVEALRIFEPRLVDLQILVSHQEPALHGDIGIGRMIPIALMGEGMQRLASILMAGIAAPGGFLLVDEVENGIHHSAMKQVFEVIGHAARENDVQIFATTHSYECIKAAQAAFAGEHADELRLHRLESVKGQLKAITYPGDVLQAALDMEREVR